MRFIEDNWLEGQRVGSGSFDAIAGTVNSMFDFSHRGNNKPFLLNDITGQPTNGPGK